MAWVLDRHFRPFTISSEQVDQWFRIHVWGTCKEAVDHNI